MTEVSLDNPVLYPIQVDTENRVIVDGIMLGKRVVLNDGRTALEICDKSPRRSAERGTRLLLIDLSSLAHLDEAPMIDLHDEPFHSPDPECGDCG